MFIFSNTLNIPFSLQILQVLGHSLTKLDLSGGMRTTISDEGLCHVAHYCSQLETLGLSLLNTITGVTFIDMFQDPQRAAKIKHIYISSKFVSNIYLTHIKHYRSSQESHFWICSRNLREQPKLNTYTSFLNM